MKSVIQLSFFIILSLFTGTYAQVSSSKWQTQSIVLDGDALDWATNPRFFNAESNVQYEFRNDARNLYLIIKSTNQATQLQLVKAGFVVRLKVKTSPPTKTSITFQALKASPMPRMRNNQGERNDVLLEKTVTTQDQMIKDSAILDGFLFTKGAIKSENTDENAISFARYKGNKEQSIYEIRIPLRELFGNDFVLDNIKVTPLQLQVVINDLSQKALSSSQGRMGGGNRGGRGQGSMVKMNGMGGEEMEDRSDMQEVMMSRGYSMSRKSFNLDFQLSNGK